MSGSQSITNNAGEKLAAAFRLLEIADQIWSMQDAHRAQNQIEGCIRKCLQDEHDIGIRNCFDLFLGLRQPEREGYESFEYAILQLIEERDLIPRAAPLPWHVGKFWKDSDWWRINLACLAELFAESPGQFSTEQLADQLGLHKRTVLRAMEQSGVPVARQGQQRFMTLSEARKVVLHLSKSRTRDTKERALKWLRNGARR